MNGSSTKIHEEKLATIETIYLVVSDIMLVQDATDRFWTDQLWYIDLVEHCKYIKNFRLAAPVRKGAPEAGMVLLGSDGTERLTVVPLLYATSLREAISQVYENTRRLAAGVNDAGIIHTCYAGWPFPMSWIAQPIAMAQRKPVVAIIESMFWKAIDENAGWKRRLRSIGTDWLNWLLVRAASVRIFSTNAYRDYYVGEYGGSVIPCSWVDPRNIRSKTDVLGDHAFKIKRSKLKALFAGRLNRQKGIPVLLDAFDIIESQGAQVDVDVLGDGPLKPDLIDATKRMSRVKYLKPVPYGEAFYRLLQEYDVVIVPSLTDEQPRIVFDAYSQGVPVVASRTPGLIDCVDDAKTGLLVEVGRADALADALVWCSRNKPELARMSMGGLESVKLNNIETMHSRRAKLLKAHGIV